MPVFSGTAAADRIVGGAEADKLYGLDGNDSLDGRDGDDWLVGGAGGDLMAGRLGNDFYDVDSSGDRVVEHAGEGVDRVRAWISYQLTANVESLTLAGTADLTGTGNSLANTIIGNAGNNVLNGGAGDDVLAGGEGQDIYDVDSAGDKVIEHASEGHDRVNASISYALSANVEDLTLVGTGNLTGTGNSLANRILGNAGNNALNGGAGDDTLAGGLGNEVYDVNSAGDRVVEHAGEGYDRVRASVSYTLSANVEELSLTGTGAINGTGNSLDNTIFGNSGDNVLDGGKGYDILVGGGGNDTYNISSLEYIDDKIIEKDDGGVDTVISSIDHWSLASNVENLIMTNEFYAIGIGNTLNNMIIGTAGGDQIHGKSGNDILSGNGGSDRIFGEDGDDTIRVGDGADLINGGDGNDKIFTGAGDVTVDGGSGDDIIESGARSTIMGGDGNDIIRGSDGPNQLWGGRGDDYLEGGLGTDRFSFSSIQNGIDTIADFRSMEGDELLFKGLLHGSFSYLGSADFTGSGNSEARFANGQVLVDTDGNGTANITIKLTGITDTSQLHASDFAF